MNSEMYDLMSGSQKEALQRQIQRTSQTMTDYYDLTPRESEILSALVAYGLSNKEVADIFYISEKTVQVHITNIKKKTSTSTIRNLFSICFRIMALEDRHEANESTGHLV
ncbi:transcriptional regulator NarP [compost metagenome]